MVNTGLNFIKATGSFLGAVPWFAGNAASILNGFIGIGTVGAAVVYYYVRVPQIGRAHV